MRKRHRLLKKLKLHSREKSWLRITKQLRSPMVISVTVLLAAFIALIVVGDWFQWGWTGFPAKTLWDWLNLLGVLAIPLAVWVGTMWFTTKQAQMSEVENRDNQREAALQAYINKMSELLLEKNLCKSAEGDEARMIARVLTLTVLPRLDRMRKRSVLQLLYESQLIGKVPIVNLSGADLSGADLPCVNLLKANLGRVNLNGANLWGAILSEANLEGVDLREATLLGTNLQHANLHKADLGRAKLIGADLRGANLHGTKFDGADLGGADLYEANLSGGTEREAFLDATSLVRTNLSNANLSGLNLAGIHLSEADLSRTNLNEVNLSKAILIDAKLSPNGLSEAIRSKAILDENDFYTEE